MPLGSRGEGVEAHPSFVVASVQSAEGHQDGGSAEAQREATGDRRGDGSTVVRQAGRAGVRTLGRRLGTSVGAETPGSPSIPAASQGGRSWLGRSSCSPAQRGCLRGVRRGECGRSLPNGWLQQTNRPLRGLARVARIAVEPCVRREETGVSGPCLAEAGHSAHRSTGRTDAHGGYLALVGRQPLLT